MSCDDNSCCRSCGILNILLSTIFGAIIGVLFAFDFIPFITLAVEIVLVIAILALVFLIVGVYLGAFTAPNALSRCLMKNTGCLLAGIIGTIISALAALSIELTPAFISVIVLVAIGAFFFSLMIIGLIVFLVCVVSKLNECRRW